MKEVLIMKLLKKIFYSDEALHRTEGVVIGMYLVIIILKLTKKI
jgi:hypothetical protein